MALGGIVQTIGIQGAEDVASSLTNLGKIGSRAFYDMVAGAQGTDAEFKQLIANTEGVVAGLTAVGAAAFAFTSLVANINDSIVASAAMAESFGMTRDQLYGLEAAMNGAGISLTAINRAMERTAVSVADGWSEIQRSTREAATQQEAAAITVVKAHEAITTAIQQESDGSSQWSLKLQGDALTVASALTNAKFASQEMASQFNNDRLAVSGAAVGIAQAMHDVQFASADMASQAANDALSVEGAVLTASQAHQRLADLESGHVDRGRQRELQLSQASFAAKQADQQVADAKLKQDKDSSAVPKDVTADLKLQQAVQQMSDALLKQAKDADAPSKQREADHALAEAMHKQAEDFAKMGPALEKLGTDVREAVNHLRESLEHQYDRELHDLEEIGKALLGQSSKVNLKDVAPHDIRRATDLLAGNTFRGGDAPNELDESQELGQVAKKGTLSRQQLEALMRQYGFRGAANASEAAQFFRTRDPLAEANKGEGFGPTDERVEKARANLSRDAQARLATRNIAESHSDQNSVAGQIADALNTTTFLPNLENIFSASSDKWKAMMTGVTDNLAAKIGFRAAPVGGDSLSGARGFNNAAASDPLELLKRIIREAFFGITGLKQDVPAKAEGGYISGPGSATSDSIMARLSNGEFVQNAAAVSHYGRDFMEAINSRSMPRFADGGRVGDEPDEFARKTSGQALGMFTGQAKVNGSLMDFLLDTGASDVVLKSDAAKAAGFDLSKLTWNVASSTANGIVNMAKVLLTSVQVGDIVKHGVEALISPGGLQDNLLGQSFLNMLKSWGVGPDGRVMMQAAEGGAIRGPGTGTSDSILARVSNGEFVMKTAAVSHWGEGFMHAINNLSFPGFSTGGLVPAGVRSSAMGAARSGGSILNLSIDGNHFNGLHAPPDVAAKLTSFAISRKTSSAGDKPSWYG